MLHLFYKCGVKTKIAVGKANAVVGSKTRIGYSDGKTGAAIVHSMCIFNDAAIGRQRANQGYSIHYAPITIHTAYLVCSAPVTAA